MHNAISISRHIDYEKNNPECRFDQLVDELALHDPLYIARVKLAGCQSLNQVNAMQVSSNQVFDGTRQKTGSKPFQKVKQPKSPKQGDGTETMAGMRYRMNQLENQIKQLKANNETLKARSGSNGTGNSFKKPWNNTGSRPGNFKGKKKIPPKNKKFTKKTQSSGDGQAKAGELIC